MSHPGPAGERRSRLVTFTLIGTGLILAWLATAWFGQRIMLFPAAWLPGPVGVARAEAIPLDPKAGGIQSLFLDPATGTPEPFPVLVFAHGNGELADDWVDRFGPLREWGWGVILFEYPGYGRRPGKPSEASIRQAVLEAYDWAARNPRIDSTRIVVQGRSLGGGAAAHLAQERRIAGLILESAFTSVRPLAAKYLIPRWLVRDPFDNLLALQSYQGPLLVIHGAADEIVPIEHGRALSAAVTGAEFHELPCGHNDCPPSWDLIHGFLARHRLMPAAPPEPVSSDDSVTGAPAPPR